MLHTVVAAPAEAGVVLQPGDRAGDGDLARVDDLLRQLGTERGEHRHRLGHREGEIKAGHGSVGRAEHRAVGSGAGENRPQYLGRHLTIEAEQLSSASGPVPRRLTATDVVILSALRDCVEVVPLAASTELRQRQHHNHPGSPNGD
jgi:hypothetical protein